jgi:hypothetical protein
MDAGEARCRAQDGYLCFDRRAVFVVTGGGAPAVLIGGLL